MLVGGSVKRVVLQTRASACKYVSRPDLQNNEAQFFVKKLSFNLFCDPDLSAMNPSATNKNAAPAAQREMNALAASLASVTIMGQV